MFYRLPFCLFDRHQPDPQDIGYVRLDMVSHCRDCGRRIRRVRKGRWRTYRDSSPVPDQSGEGQGAA